MHTTSSYLAELEPTTDAGRAFVALCESQGDGLREHATRNDAGSTFPTESLEALKRAGVLAAFVPEELGGLGLSSMLDWSAGLSRLARADPSLALGLNMHLGVSRVMARLWRAAVGRGDSAEAERYDRLLREVASGELVACASVSEAGNPLLRPHTTAVRDGEGFRIDGQKLFASLSPAATLYIVSVRVGTEEEGAQFGFALIPADAPGLLPQGNWNALGMRASGSQAVTLRECRVPADALQVVGPWGRWSPELLRERMLANAALLGVFVGIAERARELAVQGATGRSGKTRGDELGPRAFGVQQLMGELDIELYSAQCTLERTLRRIDASLAASGDGPPELAVAHADMRDFQCAKWVVNQHASAVVSRAMDICGGATFMSTHELSRLYRDVRAGAFMQPFSPSEARGYVGRVALGRAALSQHDGG